MKKLNIYIIEKFKISKNTKTSSIDSSEFDLKFEGLTLKDFFIWFEDAEDMSSEDWVSFEEFFNNSTILQVYFNEDIFDCDEISTDDFTKLIDLFISHKNDKIILYQMTEKAKVNTYCEFEVDFLSEPIGFECSTEYKGKYKEKYEL